MFKPMLKQRYKELIITLLTISAIFLTGQLWFSEISGRDIGYVFSSLFPSNTISVEGGKAGVLSTPYRIVSGTGDNYYTIIYNDLSISEQKKTADEIIFEVLANGSLSSTHALNYSDILKGGICIYEYAVSIPADAFCRSFSLKPAALSGKVGKLDKIVLKQSGFDRSVISLVIVDTAGSECYEFLLKNPELSTALNNTLLKASEQEPSVRYVSSVQSGYTMLSTNVFIPVWEGDSFLYNMAIPENPYSYKGQLFLNTIEKEVEPFFDNPTSKWSGTQNDVFTYSEGNTVVKYYQSNVLEYSFYGTTLKKTAPSFESDYYTALNFIDKDGLVTNEYYLASYRHDNTQSVFYFSYAENNFPVKLSNSVISETGMHYPIEVTVENGIVRKYRKLALSFNHDIEIQENATLKFDDYAEMFTSGDDTQAIIFDDVSFCYNMDRSSNLALYWFSSTDGITNSQSAK